MRPSHIGHQNSSLVKQTTPQVHQDLHKLQEFHSHKAVYRVSERNEPITTFQALVQMLVLVKAEHTREPLQLSMLLGGGGRVSQEPCTEARTGILTSF